MTALATFLRDGAARRFEWGACDCSLWVADWIVARTGRDPVADLRGRYATRAGAYRAMAREGGLAALFAARLGALDLNTTARPAPGDVGVIAAPAGAVGAIRTARGWAAKRETGIVIAPFAMIAAWSLGTTSETTSTAESV